MPALAAATAGSAFLTRPAGRPPVRSGYPTARAHPGPLLGSGRQGQRYRRAAKEVTQEVQGRAPCCQQVRHTDIRTDCARAPAQVRPPHTLRRMTPKRMANSARQLVASRPGCART
jgi:hypothetical protein